MASMDCNTAVPAADEVAAQALMERLRTLPEADAVRCYAGLSARWQWIARQRLTGGRRTALIVHHATAIAGCR